MLFRALNCNPWRFNWTHLWVWSFPSKHTVSQNFFLFCRYFWWLRLRVGLWHCSVRRGCSGSGSCLLISHEGKGDEEFPESFLTDQALVAKILMESQELKEWQEGVSTWGAKQGENEIWNYCIMIYLSITLEHRINLCQLGIAIHSFSTPHRPLLAVYDSSLSIIIQTRRPSILILLEWDATLSRSYYRPSECVLNDSEAASSAFMSVFLETRCLHNCLNLCHGSEKWLRDE